MAEFIDIVQYRDGDDPWNGIFIEDEGGRIVRIGKWLDSDDVNKRVLRIQSNEIENT